MIEFRNRTDLLSARAICFLFGLTDLGLGQLRKGADFPEPSHFKMVSYGRDSRQLLKALYWRRPVIDEYMEQVRLKSLVAARRKRRKE